MSAQTQEPRMPRRRAPIAITIGVVALLVIAFFVFVGLYADVLWYDQLGFLNVLTTEWVARLVLFLVGFLAMAVPVWASIQIAYRTRPVYAKLNSQLDRYQEVFEPLRRLAMYGIPVVLGIFAGVSVVEPLGAHAHLAEPHPVRHDRPAVRLRRRLLRLRAPLLPVDRRIRVRRRAALAPARHRDELPLRLHPRERPRGRDLEVRAHPDRRHGRPLPAAPGHQHLVRPVRHGHREQHAHDRRRVHRRQRRDPRTPDPRRDRRGRRHPLLRHRPHRTLAPAARRHRPAHRVEPHHRRPVPVDHPALPGRPERPVARGAVHRAQHRPHTRGLRGRRHRDHPVRGQDGRRARRAPRGRRDHGEHPPDGPARDQPRVPAARAVPPVLPVPRRARRRPLRDRRLHAGHRRRRARPAAGRPRRRRDLVQLAHRLHARLRPRGGGRQPALGRRPARVPPVRHPVDGLARRVRAARLLRRGLAGLLDRRGPRGSRPGRARLPGRRRERAADADHVQGRRRTQARQRLHEARLRAEVPVRADLPLRRGQRPTRRSSTTATRSSA